MNHYTLNTNDCPLTERLHRINPGCCIKHGNNTTLLQLFMGKRLEWACRSIAICCVPLKQFPLGFNVQYSDNLLALSLCERVMLLVLRNHDRRQYIPVGYFIIYALYIKYALYIIYALYVIHALYIKYALNIIYAL